MPEHSELLQSWKVKSEHDLKACRYLLQVDESLDWGGEIDANEYVLLAEKSCEKIWGLM